MIWWTSIVWVGVMLLIRDSLCQSLSFSLTETNVIGKEGSCVQINCTGSGAYKPSTSFWYKNAVYKGDNYNGTVVYSSSPQKPAHQDFEGRGRVKFLGPEIFRVGQGVCSIQICCLRMNDSGNYSFRYEETRDKGGRYFTEPQATLQVHEDPCKVSFQTSPIYLNESDEAVFNCSTSSLCGTKPGIKGLPMRAQFDGSSNTSTVARFVIDWEDHQRKLLCVINNDTCLRQNITLTVQYSPRNHLLNGTGKSVKLGESLTLTCSAKAVPAPTEYTWIFHTDWKNRTTHSRGWPNVTFDNMLKIQSVTKADHGCYKCSASNTRGRGNYSSSYCVEVLFAPDPPVLSVVPLATEGDVITINCSVESWPLPSSLNLSWMSDRDPSMHHLLHHVSNATSLIRMLNVTYASAGRYTCKAQNSQGSNQSETVLQVNYAPKNVSVTVKPSCAVSEGTKLELFCEAQSVPTASSYNWTRTNAGLQVVVGSDQRLTIESVTSADHGGYRCSVQNKVGSRESPEVGVTVDYAPKYANITGLSGDEYDAGVPIQLSCRSTGFPDDIVYKWYKKLNNKSNEEPVLTNQTLTVDPDNPGIYYCHASNSLGGAKSNSVRLFLNTWRLKEIFWAIPFICILVLVVFAYLVCRYKRKKCVSDGSPDPPSRPVTPSADARGSRDDLLPNQAPSHTSHAFSQAPRSSAAGPERLSRSTIDTVYSTVDLPTGTKPIREDHGYADNEVNYASLHFPSQGLSQGSSPPAAMENDVYAKIANKNYENLDMADNQLVDIELNYSQVTFTAKQRSKTKKTKKTTR